MRVPPVRPELVVDGELVSEGLSRWDWTLPSARTRIEMNPRPLPDHCMPLDRRVDLARLTYLREPWHTVHVPRTVLKHSMPVYPG